MLSSSDNQSPEAVTALIKEKHAVSSTTPIEPPIITLCGTSYVDYSRIDPELVSIENEKRMNMLSTNPPLLTESWISSQVSVERTRLKGFELFKDGHVLAFSKQDHRYFSTVIGSTGNHYHCRFTVASDGRLEDCFCNCAAFSSYPKACKHLAATFYTAAQSMDVDDLQFEENLPTQHFIYTKDAFE